MSLFSLSGLKKMMSSSLVIPKNQNLESIPGDLCKTYFKIQTVAAVGGNLHNWKFAQLEVAQIHFAGSPSARLQFCKRLTQHGGKNLQDNL